MTPAAVVCTPLLVERWALRRVPGATVRRTGMGPRRPVRDAGAVVVAGVGGGLVPHVRPGDIVVADTVRGPNGELSCASPSVMADALRRLGLRVHVGPIVSVRRPADGAERRRLAETGAIAVDMESAWLAGSAPFVAVRAIVDTPDHPLWRLGTIARGVKALRVLRRAAPAIAVWIAEPHPTAQEVT